MDYSLEPLSVTKIQSMDYFYAQSCKIVKCLRNLTSQTAFLTFFFFLTLIEPHNDKNNHIMK